MNEIVRDLTNQRVLIQCVGKERYATRSLAEKVQRRRNSRGRKVEVYRCPFCSNYHLGSRLK